MNLLNTKNLRDGLLNKLKNNNFKNKILLLSKNPNKEAVFYKNVITKRCEEFGISYEEKEFDGEKNHEIISFINSFDKADGFIILAPFGSGEDLTYLKESIKIRDLDGFTFKSLGKSMEGWIDFLPATSRAIVKFLENQQIDYRGKNITIANRTSVIGKPLSMYLASRGANVSVINSSCQNPKSFIKNSDIFISAIGKATYYDKTYFKDNGLIIDVGTSYINGKIVGDVDVESISEMNVDYLGSKSGIGAITTLTLLEGMIDNANSK
ncbi:bifunctional 5,10-methylenetetrahydrofolate dehydrogenase/5,10-methenyltetrahydrofolate cyclohydrolase [Anaerococcus sp. NML200537]|uniref:bifunctional 5,10-methylenetetrahydrofolate dehydrogenase/5,10-methenyltetrahydrofolate cyclohydrolase n=1 Tax=Anaerococcus sp. NML200537 TaxID=2954485 RepID=UPI002237F48F|nr:bifunctional 5,10-methylenetetrahydrofolate dehydrogenase/5,10-methenyltetrahydrofolate cyclohydrolase [Anaerococcus sp. NML200537]MCW6702330.1 bifunctional 5,10-methylenetetrahydrofolate dehydrogenase/5,10-methenyltetrahydrofolate cyclohydrolase [Anaerococcus sp. NML200537]